MLIVITLTSIIGVALVRMLISDSRFVNQQEGMLGARQAARAAMNTMAVEFRMVTRGGLVNADVDEVAVRVPYAFGMSCGRVGSSNTVVGSLMPADSLSYAVAMPGGIAWRDTVDFNAYNFTSLSSVTASTDTDACTEDNIGVVPGGWLVEVNGVTGSPPGRPPVGVLFYLYQTVTYRFAASVDLPGRIGLWRSVNSGPYEEIVTPFGVSAGFAFLVGCELTLEASPPADLSTVRGLELRLTSESDAITPGQSQPEAFQLVTRVPFLNVPAPSTC